MKMKKLAAALCAAALSLTAVSFSAFAADTDGVKIDETNFPDKGFMRLMKEDYDTNGDNILSSDEIKKTTTIICGWSDIANVKGVEYFTELENFSCSANPITELDMSANKKLKTLDCYTLSLEKPLDLSENTSLEVLHCGRSGITELDVSNNKELYFLNCSYNDIAQLDISQNAKLKELDCILTDISELDISNNPYLLKAYTEGRKEEHTDNDTVNDIIEDTVYYIYDGDPDSDENEDYYDLRVDSATKIITETKADGVAIDETNFPDATFRQSVLDDLDKDKNGYLSTEEAAEATSMQCANEGITSLKGIEYLTELTSLTCSNNQLTELDISKNIALTHLYCGGNQLTRLDVSGCGKLYNLYCNNNKLTSLDVSKNTALAYLYCNSNQLTSLDMSGCKELKNLHCYNNKLAELDISGNPNIIKVYTEGEELEYLPEDDLKDVLGKSYLGIPMGENEEEPFTHYYYLYWDKATKMLTEPKPEEKPETKPETKPEEKPATLTDEKTKVAVTGMLDGLKLNVKPTEAKDAVAAYDITLTDADNKAVQPSGKIEISIPCETKGLYVYHIKDDGTKEYIESKYAGGCYVFTVDHLSVYALMKDKPEEKPVTTPEETKPENKPSTGDNKPSTGDNKPSTGDTKPADDSNKPTGATAGIAFAGIALAGAALMVSKKRK